MLVDLERGIDALHLLRGGVDFLAAHVRCRVDHLALQVGEIDHVEIDEADATDAGGRQVQAEGSAEAAGADQQHLRLFQLLLAFDADFRNDQVAAVAQDFIFGEWGFRDGRFGHNGPARDGGHQR